MRCYFRRAWTPHAAGSIAEVSASIAADLIKRGICVEQPERPAPIAEEPPANKAVKRSFTRRKAVPRDSESTL